MANKMTIRSARGVAPHKKTDTMQAAKMTTRLTAQRDNMTMSSMAKQRMNNAPRCIAVRASATDFDRKVQGAICAGGLALLVALTPAMGARAEVRLPPLDTDPQRCERGYVRLERFTAGGLVRSPSPTASL